jgi:hypothetical protein
MNKQVDYFSIVIASMLWGTSGITARGQLRHHRCRKKPLT